MIWLVAALIVVVILSIHVGETYPDSPYIETLNIVFWILIILLLIPIIFLLFMFVFTAVIR